MANCESEYSVIGFLISQKTSPIMGWSHRASLAAYIVAMYSDSAVDSVIRFVSLKKKILHLCS